MQSATAILGFKNLLQLLIQKIMSPSSDQFGQVQEISDYVILINEMDTTLLISASGFWFCLSSSD